jgi:phosphatidylserine/phosphatidylglycerophosphate/cardiolipin synthase-like enzyme
MIAKMFRNLPLLVGVSFVALSFLIANKGGIPLPDFLTEKSAEVEGVELEWGFTQAGQHPEKLLIEAIDSAQETLDVAIYSLTLPEIVNSLKQAKKRGVQVRVIVDESQSQNKAMNQALKILGGAGIKMKVNRHDGLMHLKMIIVDNRIASTGSYNFSKAATTRNDEIVVLIRSAEVAQSFAENFQEMWDNKNKFEPLELDNLMMK